ncbi:MAG: hypothetical protein WC750_01515 [Patescibacteria group bacterium]|jgi:hypothetical protein
MTKETKKTGRPVFLVYDLNEVEIQNPNTNVQNLVIGVWFLDFLKK